MGLSLLTRYNLFMESSQLIKSGNTIIQFRDSNAVMNMYYASARLIRRFEDIINDEEDISPDSYQSLFEKQSSEVPEMAQRIRELIQNQLKMKENLYELPFKTFFRYLLKAITVYQGEIIAVNYIPPTDMEDMRAKKKQTFLSYAYYDKGLTLALFYYFWMRSGFLYVNWMWEGLNNHSATTKSSLENALTDSNQFLFLRTPNSELRIPGNNGSVRQWCAWEIGNFYTKHEKEKYYTSFYDKGEPRRNDILDTFKPMKEVLNGEIKC